MRLLKHTNICDLFSCNKMNYCGRKLLQRSGKDFTIMKVLPPGVYQFRFIVDGEWKYAPDIQWMHDDLGNAYNILDLQVHVFCYPFLFFRFTGMWFFLVIP